MQQRSHGGGFRKAGKAQGSKENAYTEVVHHAFRA